MDASSFIFLVLNLHILCSLSLLVPTKSASNETDLSALLSFKALVSGDPLDILSSWNGSVHHCQWPGIRCGGHHPDRVSSLVLKSSHLSGQISPALSNLTFLLELSLSDNQFTGIIPEELGKLTRLRSIDLSNNPLGGYMPSTLGNCTKLLHINLRKNNLQGTIPSSLGLSPHAVAATIFFLDREPFLICETFLDREPFLIRETFLDREPFLIRETWAPVSTSHPAMEPSLRLLDLGVLTPVTASTAVAWRRYGLHGRTAPPCRRHAAPPRPLRHHAGPPRSPRSPHIRRPLAASASAVLAAD
ncbi:hypothetical protein QYE76_039051 [Lolium multiflorum]|uniref:Leucine-rich repeat-containing N-terminal plant-type domain-containing protein n=1 Tax=Lolium multiflorum TaxID=4521 RepID=A0AAD8TAM6_LOLMU|nr:hypothetical protein QYE76_039051 [Lolium multiflorum]